MESLVGDRSIRLHPEHFYWLGGEEWFKALDQVFRDKITDVLTKIRQMKQRGTIIYPSGELVFNALVSTSLSQVKVVILGQDPYHDGSANGLAFSSMDKVTPSLRVIFKELNRKGIIRSNPNLQDWADQGVLLLNTVLTVEKGKAGSHKGLGWEFLTKEILRTLLNTPETQPIVFMLWGKEAQNLLASVMEKNESELLSKAKYIIKTPHPQAENYSPGIGFINSNCFGKCNVHLRAWNLSPIEWGDS